MDESTPRTPFEIVVTEGAEAAPPVPGFKWSGVHAGIKSDGALDLGYDADYRDAVVGQLAAFSRCLRARGVEDFPDPIPGFIGIGSPYPGAEIPYNDPDLPDAVIRCEGTVFGDSALIDG